MYLSVIFENISCLCRVMIIQMFKKRLSNMRICIIKIHKMI